jgi:hypothetical protein
MPDADVDLAETTAETLTEIVVAHLADHIDRITQTSNPDSLVGAFAAVKDLEFVALQRFAGPRDSFSGADKIEIDTTDDNDR